MDDGPRLGALTILLGLAIAGCGERAAGQRPPPAAPPSTPQGPVNPDAGVTVYACADGQTITAGYPDAQTAVVTYKDHAYTLKLARSASGARYTGYGLQWWTKGPQARISVLKPGEDAASAPGVDCAASQGAPQPSVTRTGYEP